MEGGEESMKKYSSMWLGLGMLALLLAVPVWAEMAVVSDSDLGSVTGKNNYLENGSANIQIDIFSWTDDHTADQSDHKGANDQSGTSSTVQSDVHAAANVINWGAAAQNNLVSDSIAGTQENMSYGVFAGGGF
jgi:hypothetical protein